MNRHLNQVARPGLLGAICSTTAAVYGIYQTGKALFGWGEDPMDTLIKSWGKFLAKPTPASDEFHIIGDTVG
jgi:hypothetical protein